MSEFQPAPTWAEVVLVDEQSGKFIFNPIWLNWFLELTALLTAVGGGSGTIDHNSLGSLQGGSAAERFHLSSAVYTVLVTDPGSDKILFWDDSAGSLAYLTVGSGLAITATTLDATGGSVPDPLLLGNGSASAPTYSFTSDTNTGVYRVSADTLGFTTAGAEAWRITSTGDLRGPDASGVTATGTDRTIEGGPGGATSGAGGALNFIGGATSAGNGGQLTFAGGTGLGNSNQGGALSMIGGIAGAGTFASGGSVQIAGGANINATGIAGSVSVQGGHAAFGATKGHAYLAASDGTSLLKANSDTYHTSFVSSGAPTITAGGGTSPTIAGKDQSFTVTIGTGGIATTFTVTFANAFTNAPPATANSDTDIVALKCATTTTTVIVTATAPFTASSKVHVNVGSWE